ncbi:hypothetical protein ACK3SF_00585 [Candidatus Nanosalina sp. VS9-1]|uniref:hypothetical protein n=1 Tax=Candidatus Nanosalina sp. VS9-1 TaxID=3388566 RepID=UPI0039E0FD42
MDKTLEIIMVAMTLVVAAVVVISMLQGESGDFGEFSDGQQESSQCGLEELKYERALDKESCSETTAAENIRTGSSCDWAGSSSQASDYC